MNPAPAECRPAVSNCPDVSIACRSGFPSNGWLETIFSILTDEDVAIVSMLHGQQQPLTPEIEDDFDYEDAAKPSGPRRGWA
ncbi:hypothetical protein [Mesorhizobium sp. WSM2561]|uniref:hypothetical protein n=1 Tax=Mesorhizobium sp. WSM2561 TaxID=1040985 RepID=UPI0004B8523C|nr:hypothetical protein [Mesorhizobium sp. WSM2561]